MAPTLRSMDHSLSLSTMIMPLGLLGDVVERLKRDAVGEGRVAGDGNHVLLAAGQVAGHGHAQSGGQRGSGVAGAVAVVLALGAQHEAVEPAGLANGLKAVQATGKNLVDIGLVADVEEQLVFGGIEDRVQSQREFHDAKVGPRWPPVFESVWIRNSRISSANSAICAKFRRFRSAGEWMDSSSVAMYFLPPEEGQASKKRPLCAAGRWRPRAAQTEPNQVYQSRGWREGEYSDAREPRRDDRGSGFPVTDFRQSGDVGWR